MQDGNRTLNWQVVKATVFGTVKGFSALKLPMIAAGIAFYGILSLFPALTALVALWSYVSDPVIVQNQLELIRGFLPAEAYGLINTQIAKLVATDSTTLGWASVVSLGAALWSARLGVTALMDGLNVAHRTKARSALRQFATAIAITLLLIGVALAALAAVVVTPVVLAFLPLGPAQAAVLSGIRWLIAVGLVVMAISVLYRYGPNRDHKRGRWLNPGVVLAVLIWAGASWLLSFYLSNFGNYNEVYGTLGAVIALLLWLWLSAIAVLAGALLNAEFDAAKRARAARMPPAAQTPLGVDAQGLGRGEEHRLTD